MDLDLGCLESLYQRRAGPHQAGSYFALASQAKLPPPALNHPLQ